MKKLIYGFVLFSIVALAIPCLANNIQVGTPTITGQNTTDNYTLVQFDLSWENSFRDNINWDAAWVFVKFKEFSSWQHAFLNTTAGNHTIPAGYTCTVGETGGNGMGVFVYRDANGSGNTNLSSVQLRWEYGANGLGDDALVTLEVFAIEMVYVPTGAFAAGSGGSEGSCFTLTTINTGDATTAPSGTGGFSGSAEGGYPTGQTAPSNASWPNGYGSFYCMKYEISQGQYADFLNTLTTTQDGNRSIQGETIYTTYRGTIGGSQGSRSASRPDRACNFLSWADGCAYTDWSGLRPMTELEFEKACRGTLAPVANEYAWGNTSITAATTISDTENGTETITNSGANCCYSAQTFTGGDGGQGPLRCGIFAESATTREQAGASYYGIMELSGNLGEHSVTVGNGTGRGFTGVHGNGSLDSNGDANVSNWPGTDAIGSGFRGGIWSYDASIARVSDRDIAGYTFESRFVAFGFRCVRSLP